MNLAYSLNDKSIDNINSFKDSYINKIIDFSLYKDCKSFVNFVNKSKFFSFILLILEIDAGKRTEKASMIEEIEAMIEAADSLVSMVKNYPNKDLKRKYMRIDNDEMEIFNFLKIRYKQICEGLFIGILNEACNKTNDEAIKTLDSMPLNELMSLLLGAIYNCYANENADFLTSVVKKLIKKANQIANKYFPTFTSKTDFNTANEITSKAYEKALNELAQ